MTDGQSCCYLSVQSGASSSTTVEHIIFLRGSMSMVGKTSFKMHEKDNQQRNYIIKVHPINYSDYGIFFAILYNIFNLDALNGAKFL